MTVFEGIIPVYQRGGTSMRLAIWDRLAETMGAENIYFELIDRPEFLHAIMNRMTEAALSGIKQMNQLGLVNDLANEVHCSMAYTDNDLPDFATGKGTHSKNTWQFAMAQVFTSVAPSTTKAFEIDYMKKITAEYGHFYYGCCERLDDRLEIIQELPNVRKISCSPWSDREHFIETIRKDLIASNKPSPSFVSGSQVDFEVVRKDLQFSCDTAKKYGKKVEFILKDLSTINYKPERLEKWSEVAMQVVENL